MGTITGCGRRKMMGSDAHSEAARYGNDGNASVPIWTKVQSGQLPTVTMPKMGGYPDGVT